MRKIIVLLLILAILATAGILVFLAFHGDDDTNITVSSVSEEYPYMSKAFFQALSENQQNALIALFERDYKPNGDENYFVHYLREEQIILGNITDKEVRLTKEDALQIISGLEKDADIYDAFYQAFPYCDAKYQCPYLSRRCITQEYWINGYTDMKIYITTDGYVYYVEYDEYGKETLREQLYPIQEVE